MRAIAVLLSLAVFLALIPTQWAAASSVSQLTLQQKRKQALADKKRMNQHFKGIEREADGLLNGTDDNTEAGNSTASDGRSPRRP